MCYVEDGDARMPVDILEKTADLAVCILVESTQGLVQTQDRWVCGQGSPKGYPLRFTAAQGPGHTIQ